MEQNRSHAYLGTNSMRGSQGIYHISMDKETLDLRVEDSCPAKNGDYLWISPDRRTLYAAYELIYFQGRPTGGAAAYRIGPNGSLTFLNARNTDGQLTCFCSTDQAGQHLLTSSYMSGSVTVTPLLPDGSLGEGMQVIRHPVRSGSHWPSVHSVYETPDRNFLLSTNVGLDRVFLHQLTKAGWRQAFELPVAGRPRQAAFSPDGKTVYVSTEAGGEVFVLAYDSAAAEPLRQLQRVSTTCPGWCGHAETAGIKLSPDGSLLLVANRAEGLNNLAAFAVNRDTGLLKFSAHVPVQGVFPRDFDFTPDGRYVLVGLQFSDTLELFEADYSCYTLVSLGAGFPLPCCSCVKFLPEGGGHA